MASVPAGDVPDSALPRVLLDAADQAGLSRRYGGIHFEQGDVDARRTGRLAAARAWDTAQALFRGAV